jgi:hypothetical protein
LAAPTSGDTVSLFGFSIQASFISAGPSIIIDETGVINGGSYQPAHVVSGSWVAV